MQKTPSLADMQAVAPAFARYTSETVLNGLWKRPQLTPRERSIVTYAALVARNQVIEQPRHLRLALDNGVTPAEIAEIVTHLAFYAGWANASAAVAAALPVFEERGIGASQLADAAREPLPLDEAAEAQRATLVSQLFDDVAPGVVQYTTDALFRDLWLRPGLVPRKRSLVTVTALVANGQAAQITYHLNRAMDNGLTKAQASETLTQLAFYSGWPNVFSAMPVFKEVFERRSL